MEFIHFKRETVEEKFIINFRYLRSLVVRALHPLCKGVGLIPAGEPIVHDEFFSTVTGLNFDKCVISTRTKTHLPFRDFPLSDFSYLVLQVRLKQNVGRIDCVCPSQLLAILFNATYNA